ncbi:MAG TPA: penicillin-binding transpeptidase domain-containing protein [Patescibacteria group bacterium]|nr:penicillin-binding transpeptidase domain-containing protein [Patescibacteria group bacterium]
MKLGKAFSDSVEEEHNLIMRKTSDDEPSWWLGMGRVLLFISILCIAFFILLWRLFDLTIVQGHHFRVLADDNRTKELVRHAPRGLLLDRTGKPLVTNIPYYRLLKPCSGTTDIDCVTPVSREEGDALAKKGLPAGTFLEVDYRRDYLMPEALSHVIGYTGELTPGELTDEYYKLRDYRAGDRIGRAGAEAVFEDRLRGRDGKELVEVDAHGKAVRSLGRDPEIPGEDITLSIDAKLQQVAMDAFPKGEKGAIIVTNPSTGEVLAMYSSPTYDLNTFSNGLSESEYTQLVDNPDQPMFNRAIGGVYPPGSTFKMILSVAALEEGAVTKDTTIGDTGVITIGPFTFSNWFFTQYGKTDGIVNIVKALQRSNDIFFYKVGELLGISKLSLWARKMGLGKPLGIELAGEASGLVPDPAWKKTQFTTPQDLAAHNDEWYLGDTYHVAIGQGYLLVTPLQVSAWTNIIADNGLLCQPTIEKVAGPFLFGRGIHCSDVGIKKETIDLVTQGMYEACQTGGTGWPLFNFGIHSHVIPAGAGIQSSVNSVGSPVGAGDDKSATSSASFTSIPVACKTGTAEFGDASNKTHAWFTAFAPVPAKYVDTSQNAAAPNTSTLTGTPQISVTVLVEGAGEGSNVAAPIAKKIFEEWFGR